MMESRRARGNAEREFQAPTGILAKAPYSAAVRVGDVIFVSGQIGVDDVGRLVPGGVGGQTRACLQAIKDILEAMGASLADIVQTRVFLTDFDGYDDYNRAYREYFTAPFPTRSTLGTPQLALGAEVEIEAVAIARQPDREPGH
jgi:2-iminobutanoate/2-iminopropanoate deaminase